MTPRLISGWPNLAVSAATIMLAHIIASSHSAAEGESGDSGDHRLLDGQHGFPVGADELFHHRGGIGAVAAFP